MAEHAELQDVTEDRQSKIVGEKLFMPQGPTISDKKYHKSILDTKSSTDYANQLEKTRAELQKSQQDILDILDSINDPFIVMDSNYRTTYISSWLAHELGRTTAELLGENILNIFPGLANTDVCKKCLKVTKEKAPVHFETYGALTNRCFEVNAYPCRDGISIYAKDITERKRAEESLRQSEERFFKIFHNSPDIIAIVDMKDNRYVDVNQRFIDILGYSREELNVLAVNRQDIGHFYHALRKIGKVEASELKLRTKTGPKITVLYSAETFELHDKVYQVVIAKDITKEKKLEAEIARLDRLHLVGEMAAGIAHEIRNPMTTVRGFLQLFGTQNELSRYKKHLDLMIEELDRANAIISEFLSLAKNKTTALKNLNLNTLVETIFPLLQADATVANKLVVLDLQKIPELRLNEKEIHQMILNLVRNGLEAIPPKETVTVKTYMEDERVVLAVADRGSGIPPEIANKIDRPFFTTRDKGTGLGLAICHSIAKRHDAGIDFVTGPGGTTFLVRFKP